jgi:hypothetical protein
MLIKNSPGNAPCTANLRNVSWDMTTAETDWKLYVRCLGIQRPQSLEKTYGTYEVYRNGKFVPNLSVSCGLNSDRIAQLDTRKIPSHQCQGFA